MSRSMYWVFTMNNWDVTPVKKAFWEQMLVRGGYGLTYCIFQEESGVNSHTNHLQGYFEFGVKKRLTCIKTALGLPGIHLELRRGSQTQAIDYARKEETRVLGGIAGEWGVKRVRRPRTNKFSEVIEKIKAGELDLEETRDDEPSIWAMHRDKIIDYSLELKGKRHWPMEVHIYVGPTGCGKSMTAKRLYPDAYYVPWPAGGRWWWPFYQGQPEVILDEFRHQLKLDVLLKFFDRYPMKLEAKGRSFEFVSRKIILTTNIDPVNWYPKVSKEVKSPLARRIQEFATIWDFAAISHPLFPGHLPVATKVARTGDFEFADDLPVVDFAHPIV